LGEFYATPSAKVIVMNKIVREHYPVKALPEDLREGLDPKGNVRVVIEEDIPPVAQQKKLLELLENARQSAPLDDDPVGRIRKLRDEWDD
jgi:hypothetical protein